MALRSQHMNDWLCMHDPRCWIHRPDRLDSRDARPYQLVLDFPAGVVPVRMDVPLLARRPRQKIDFVDRSVETGSVQVIRHEAGRRAAISGKAIDETGAQNVQIIGPAVMTQRQYDLDSMAAGSLH